MREPVHFARFGTFVTTPQVSGEEATVQVQATFENQSGVAGSIKVSGGIFKAGPNGKPQGLLLASFDQAVPEQGAMTIETQATLEDPALWSPQSPNLYVAVTELSVDGRVVDARQTVFGVRTIEASAANGFLLNGKPILL